MARIEDLADRFERHIATPWQRTISGAQRVVMLVYDKEMERTLRARKAAFETAARQAGHDWHEIDVSDAFASWMASDEYREEYFGSPEDLQLKLQAEFPNYVAERLRASCGRDLKILMLSANAFERHGLSGQQASHDAFLLKPVDLGSLLDALGRHLQLEWILPEAREGDTAARDRVEVSAATREHVEKLKALVQIGHVRALEGEIKALAAADPAADKLAVRLFDHLDRFDLAGIGRILEDLPDEWR